MDLTVPYKKCSSKNEAFEAAKTQITPEYIQKFNVKADVDFRPEKGIIEAKGKGFTLTLNFTDKECKVALELSFLLKPFRSKVLETIERKLQKTV